MQELLKTLALAYTYPTPGLTKTLWEQVKPLPTSSAKARLERFLKVVSELTLSEREELYTRTLDLTPLTAPYVAYSVYGEDYRRGTFMATMNRELAAHQVDTAGELPDHLIPVLRYLAVATEPLPELLELLEPALNQIHHTLKVLEKHNPYLMLIEATREAVEPISREQRAKSREPKEWREAGSGRQEAKESKTFDLRPFGMAQDKPSTFDTSSPLPSALSPLPTKGGNP